MISPIQSNVPAALLVGGGRLRDAANRERSGARRCLRGIDDAVPRHGLHDGRPRLRQHDRYTRLLREWTTVSKVS